jgi:hypothetical protein
LRRLAWCALATLAACGAENKAGPAPLDVIREPTGLAVHHGRLLVVNSNGDLTYDEATGGVLLSLGTDPLTATSVRSGVRVHSMGGDLVVARTEAQARNVPDAEACGTMIDLPLAIFATRGSNTLNAVGIQGDGTLTCAGPSAACGIPVGGSGFGDPLPVAVACGNGKARAYFGYLNAHNNQGWLGEVELKSGAADRFGIRTVNTGTGPIRGLAYDRDRDRLFIAGFPTGSTTPIRWVNLAGCTLDAPAAQGGCAQGAITMPVVTGPAAIEFHAIALAPPAVPGVRRSSTEPIRAYLTGLLYDASSASTAGYRTTSFGGVLVVADLYDDAAGLVKPEVVAVYALPAGAMGIQLLPRPAGWSAARRDVVAVASVDAGLLTLYDDETGSVDTFGIDASGAAATGAPILGHQPFGLAVDPDLAGSTARLWVGSFADSFVTPIDVTLGLDPALAATFAGDRQLKITGANTGAMP